MVKFTRLTAMGPATAIRLTGVTGTPITPLSDAISMPPLLVSGIIGVIGAKDPTKVSSLLLWLSRETETTEALHVRASAAWSDDGIFAVRLNPSTIKPCVLKVFYFVGQFTPVAHEFQVSFLCIRVFRF
jgi:hypothetical protein